MKLLNIRQLADELGLTTTLPVVQLIEKGIIPIRPVGRRRRFFNLNKVIRALKNYEIKEAR